MCVNRRQCRGLCQRLLSGMDIPGALNNWGRRCLAPHQCLIPIVTKSEIQTFWNSGRSTPCETSRKAREFSEKARKRSENGRKGSKTGKNFRKEREINVCSAQNVGEQTNKRMNTKIQTLLFTQGQLLALTRGIVTSNPSDTTSVRPTYCQCRSLW